MGGGINVLDLYTSLTYYVAKLLFVVYLFCTRCRMVIRGVVKRGDSVLFKDQLWRLPMRSAVFPHG